MSFVTLSVYWVAHHRIFRWVINDDRSLIWITISFLITFGLVPFSTRLLTQYKDQQISIFIYSFNSILAGLIVYSLYRHANGSVRLVDERIRILTGNMAHTCTRILATILTYSIAITFSFIYLPVSLFLLLLAPLLEFIPDRYFGKSAHARNRLTDE